jgi:major type 1 subunit fimbrin (pilin)
MFNALCANAHASSGTITFTGSIASQTCAPAIGTVVPTQGTQNFSVTLPSISADDLKTSGTTAGEVGFSISVSNCTSATGKVATFFENGPAVHSPSGRLTNMTPTSGGGAANVHIELLNAADRSPIRVGTDQKNQITQWVSLTSTTPPGTGKAVGNATMNYLARYHAHEGPAKAGTVTSKVTYSMVWQ